MTFKDIKIGDYVVFYDCTGKPEKRRVTKVNKLTFVTKMKLFYKVDGKERSSNKYKEWAYPYDETDFNKSVKQYVDQLNHERRLNTLHSFCCRSIDAETIKKVCELIELDYNHYDIKTDR